MSRPGHGSARARETWELQDDARFEVRRRLGSGSFGAVFEVFDRTRGATVALKLLRRVEPEDLYRFKQEFRALAGVTHPNLCELYELSGDGDRWFFTMELVEGDSVLAFVRPASEAAEAPTASAVGLSLALLAEAPGAILSELPGSRRPGFDELRVRSALVQLVEGLSALHAAGKMHRDVKPSNVLVTREGRVVLVDFGLAVRLSSSGARSRAAVVGTPEYLAPEIIQGKAATEAGDWYGVGVILYEALTGRLPFSGTLHELLVRKVQVDPPPPSALVDDVPADLDELCAALLCRDPAARLAGPALLAQLGGSVTPRSGRREVPFVGREAEREALGRLFDPIAEGHAEGQPARRAASVALVGGPSGIGKSALLDQACADLRRRAPGALLLTARCYEQESVPYKAIDGLVDPLSRYLKQLSPRVLEPILPRDVRTLAWLFPVLDQVDVIAESPVLPAAGDPHERRRRAVQALRDLLGRIAQRGPLAIVIDDLQWGDRDSALLLLDLLTPPAPPPLFLLAAYRSAETETSACLETLLPALAAMAGPSLHVGSIALGALTEPDALALARALLPAGRAGEEDLCAAISREARGRPFLVRELCELSGARAGRDGAEDVSVDALVRARVAALPEGPRRLLEVLSVAGRPVDRVAAVRAAGLGEEGPSAYLLLRNARLLRRRDVGGHDELEPYHDRIREAVAAGLPAERRADCSRRLAAALDGTGRVDPESLAVYHLDGGDRARAAALMRVAAADAAAALAFDGAVRLYRGTLDLMPPDAADRAAVQESLGEALAGAGLGAQAAAALVVSAQGAPPDRAFDLHRRAAELLLAAGYVEEGLGRLRGCLAEAGVEVPERAWIVTLGTVLLFALLFVRGLRSRLRPAGEVPAAALRRLDACSSASSALHGVDPALGAYFSLRALLLALAAGEPGRTFDALIAFSMYGAALHGRPASLARRALGRAGEIGAGLGLSEGPVLQGLARGMRALLEGDLRVMGAELDPVLASLRGFPTNRSWALNVAEECRFSHLFWSGAWRALSAALPGAIADARERDNRWLGRSLSLRFGHVEHLLADDPEGAAKAHAAARVGWWPPRFGALDLVSMCLRADVQLYADRGRGRRAHDLVGALWPSFAGSPVARLRGPAMFALHARAGAALGLAATEGVTRADREAALAIAKGAARRLSRIGNPLALGFARMHGAALASARGDEMAAAAWREAEEALAAAGSAHLAAAARWRRGAALSGPEGARVSQEAEGQLTAEGARDPGRLAAMLAPGR